MIQRVDELDQERRVEPLANGDRLRKGRIQIPCRKSADRAGAVRVPVRAEYRRAEIRRKSLPD